MAPLESVHFVLLVAAAVCFGLAAANRPVPPLNVMALGLLLWELCDLIPAGGK